MAPASRRSTIQLAALSVPLAGLAALGLWGVPTVLSRTTFSEIVLLVAGTATVALLTWKHAQPTSSIGQVIHDVDAAVPVQRDRGASVSRP
jgi:hypothetical protein